MKLRMASTIVRASVDSTQRKAMSAMKCWTSTHPIPRHLISPSFHFIFLLTSFFRPSPFDASSFRPSLLRGNHVHFHIFHIPSSFNAPPTTYSHHPSSFDAPPVPPSPTLPTFQSRHAGQKKNPCSTIKAINDNHTHLLDPIHRLPLHVFRGPSQSSPHRLDLGAPLVQHSLLLFRRLCNAGISLSLSKSLPLYPPRYHPL